MNADNLIATGRLIAARRTPYFREVLLSLVPTEVPPEVFGPGRVPTMGVTIGLILVYDKTWVETLTAEEAGAVIWHEAMHVVLDHGRRRGERHPLLWNIAADLFINDQGKKAGYKFPKGGLFPEMFGLPDNLSADEYYARLMQQAEEDDDGADGVGQDAKDKSASGDGVKWKWTGCGSGAGNPFEDEPDGKGDSGARSESDAQQIRNRTAHAINEHMEQHKGRGHIPLGLDVWARAHLEPPRVPWQALLARCVRSAIAYRKGAVDYKHGKLSRRQAALGYGPRRPILPALVAPVPRVAVVLDTSGSMLGGQLEEGVNEACGVLEAVGAEITLSACDAAVHSLKQVRSKRDLLKLVKGGGGTDFRPAFDELMKLKNPPEVVIFMTDGDGAAPATPPPFKVIWLLIDAYREPAPWGDKITISTSTRRKAS